MKLDKKYEISIPCRGGWRRLFLAVRFRSDLYLGVPKKSE